MRQLSSLLVVALVALLAACGPQPESRPRGPAAEPTAAPVFADEAEALAAAEEAYAAYWSISDQISIDGGRDPERIESVVTDELAVREVASSNELLSHGQAIVGHTSFDAMEIVYFDDLEVQVDVCVDVSATSVLDAAGRNITPADRIDRLPIRALFAIEDGRLLVESSEVAREGTC